MARNPLRGSIVKVHRAKEHFNSLNAQIQAFKTRNTHEIITDEDTEPAIKIYKFREIEKIPAIWGGMIGDIVHNCASALDSLATSLVIKAGFDDESIIQNTYFPIHRSRDDFAKGKSKAFFDRVGSNVEKLVRALEPHQGGKGEALWYLHRLDIVDKHRTIVTAGIDLSGASYTWPVDPKIGKLPDRTIDRSKPPFPLKDGDEIARTAFFEEHFDAKAHFTFDIAFSETTIIDGQPVMPRLRHFIELVDGIIQLFDREFFKTGHAYANAALVPENAE